MKRFHVLALALLGLLLPLPVFAADDAAVYEAGHTFSDPAMSFVAPDAFKKIALPQHDPATFDEKAVVAAFVRNPGARDTTTISITMDNFSKPDARAFAEVCDNDLRGGGNVFIKKSFVQLSNGMPAAFEEVTQGEGFNQIVSYRYIWADGVRGVIVAETGMLGALDDRKAKADMASLSATAFPRYRY